MRKSTKPPARSTDSRLRGGATDGMPDADEVWRQMLELGRRLKAASAELPFSRLWVGASGTVIMQHVFTMPRFFQGVRDYLYLFVHCASKTMCEAVIEGVGSVWDQCASPVRHLGMEASQQECAIAYNGPPPYHPAAPAFIARTLNLVFNGKAWKFTHKDQRTERIPAFATSGESKVTHKHKTHDASRLPESLFK